ncbi:hypothetical protein B0H10DRAFT_1972730 [Mycena sp. CBHHK59/15]|nr:hypothetical protein B0H10DRAFT_1972730 [Mycena sp. CBHHK59/15]
MSRSPFSKGGIPSIAINYFTPDDPVPALEVLPKQCGPYQGHIPRFAQLLYGKKWAKNPEAKNPPFGQLIQTLENDFVYIFQQTHLAAYSASMPPDIMNLLRKTLQMELEQTVTLELTTNRLNLVHAVIPMIGSNNNFSNFDFLIPDPFPPNFVLPKLMIWPHMNRSDIITQTSNSFKEANGNVRGLIATELASNLFAELRAWPKSFLFDITPPKKADLIQGLWILDIMVSYT